MVDPEQQPKKRAKWPWMVGGVFALLVVIGMAGGGGQPGQPGAPQAASAPATPALKVTATELVKAYAANEAAAQKQYGGQPLEVTGKLKSVDLGFNDVPGLVLVGDDMFTNPQMALTEASQAKAASLTKGQQIVAICAGVSEVIGTPMLEDCELQ